MNYIHYTEEFKTKIASDSKQSLIYNKLEDLRSIDKPENLNSIDPYAGILVLKYIKSNTCRIIIQPHWLTIDEEQVHVYFVRDYISKKGFDYFWGNITHPQLVSGEWLKNNPLSQFEIQAFEIEHRNQKANHLISRTPLPKSLIDWLEDFKIKLDFDVYEREEWVLYSNDKSLHDGLNEKHILLFRDTLKSILNKGNNPAIKIECINPDRKIYSAIYVPFNIGIIYNDFENIEDKRVIVLHNGAHIKDQKARWDKSLEAANSSTPIVEANLLSISKDAFRAYPKWIVTNEGDELWNAIQRYEGSHNLSLLPEQVSFLNNFKFPAYINGQAGSGKSTMLYYLFANVYFYKQLDALDGNIIFLTENDHLLEHTSKSVLGLLSSNPEFNIGLTIEQRNDVRKHFSSFKNYLLSLLPEEEKSSFGVEKYLDFARFKELLKASQNLSKKYSAEEIWFVISTYVYGYYEDKIIDSVDKYTDENNGIPSKFRIVSPQNFSEIINLYLNFYKKLIEDGHWDKTTLVRLIRDFYPTSLPQQFSVVFCDEAQDFSRIELRLIIQSSLFTNYDLSNISQIPIVFAGDALQTVSPTGFSDTRLHQMYYDSFHEANFHYDKSRSTYNPEFNYRSLQPIVRLANVIQNYRKETLKEDIFIKQESKRGNSFAAIPVLHEKEWLLRHENRKLFETKFKYKAFIVPVDLNEESTYVQNETLLFEKFPDIKSSIDAKGAEYSQVVVYGFGDYFLNEFGPLSWESVDNDFKKRFFFNKLYVAITRAQNELVIIDGSNSINKFWKPLLTIPDTVEKWEHYDDINELLPINPETGLASIEDSTPDDALNNATLDMEQAINDSNVGRLVVASNVFLLLGKVEEAHYCLAYKEKIRRNWIVAGNSFLKAQKLEDAADSFFQAQAWETFLTETKSLLGYTQETRILIVKLMNAGSWTKEELTKVYKLRNYLSQIISRVEWHDQFAEKIREYVNHYKSSGEEKRLLAYILESIVKDADSLLWRLVGKLYFDTKQYSNAIEAWNNIVYDDIVPKYFVEYIKANIEKAKDEQNKIDEFLWVGRLLQTQISVGERNKLSTNLREAYFENKTIIDDSAVKVELYTHLYHSSISTGDFLLMKEIGVFVEKNTAFEKLTELYACFIYHCLDENISIFLKERWAKNEWKRINQGTEIDENILKKINDKFINHNFPFPDSNYPWTIFELQEIPFEPSIISQIPEEHFRNLQLKNFRKFRDISLQNIGQFNLILGNNNSGKTTLLEALLFCPQPDEFLLRLLYARHQRNNNAKKEKDIFWFNNLITKGVEENHIEFILRNGRRFWSYVMRNPTSKELLEILEINEGDRKLYLGIKEKLQPIKISPKIDHLAFESAQEKLKIIPFVPFGKGYSEDLSAIYFNEIGSKRGVRNAFIEQMKIFIPSIVDITIDPDSDTIIIEEEKIENEKSFSVHDYGEGANKLFRILVQLHAARNNRLMIDEIDAGVHYSRFHEFWRAIIKTADTYNVQLFVTTHNDECIRIFIEVLNEEGFDQIRGKSRIITLEQHLNMDLTVPLIRDFQGIEYAYDHQIEIRGRKL
jgi:AAA15 family ATPase/GTPase